MGNNDIQNMKVKKQDLDKARGIHFGVRLHDHQILRAFLDFCNECPKEFKKWKKNKFKLKE